MFSELRNYLMHGRRSIGEILANFPPRAITKSIALWKASALVFPSRNGLATIVLERKRVNRGVNVAVQRVIVLRRMSDNFVHSRLVIVIQTSAQGKGQHFYGERSVKLLGARASKKF